MWFLAQIKREFTKGFGGNFAVTARCLRTWMYLCVFSMLGWRCCVECWWGGWRIYEVMWPRGSASRSAGVDPESSSGVPGWGDNRKPITVSTSDLTGTLTPTENNARVIWIDSFRIPAKFEHFLRNSNPRIIRIKYCRVRKGAGSHSVVSVCRQTLAVSISKAFI